MDKKKLAKGKGVILSLVILTAFVWPDFWLEPHRWSLMSLFGLVALIVWFLDTEDKNKDKDD